MKTTRRGKITLAFLLTCCMSYTRAKTDDVELTWASPSQQQATEDPGETKEATGTRITTKKSSAVCTPEDYPGYNVTLLECGGLIEMPNLPSTSAYLMKYKSGADRTKDPQEHCLWTFNNIKDGKDAHLQVKVTLLFEEATNSNTSFSILNWKWIQSDWVLASNDLSSGTNTKYSSVGWDFKLFLSYTSPSNVKSGFLALIEVTEAQVTSTASCLHYETSTGSQTFGPFKSYYRFSLVLNPQQTQTNFTVNYLDSKDTNCVGSDTLDVFEIRPKTQPRRLDRLCGNVTTPRSYISTFPFIATFETKYSTSGNGFQVSWK